MSTNNKLKVRLASRIAFSAILLSCSASVFACPYDNAVEGSDSLFVESKGRHTVGDNLCSYLPDIIRV